MRTLALCCCLLLLLAGCQGTPAPGTSTTTAPPTQEGSMISTEHSTPGTTTDRHRNIDVDGGELPYDVGEVWQRVAGIVGADVGPPVAVTVENLSTEKTQTPPRFQQLLGVEGSASGGPLGRTTPPGNQITLDDSALNRSTGLETTLAHEYLHTIQMRQNFLEPLWDEFHSTRDGVNTYRAIVEGSATYVSQRYTQRYTNYTQVNLRKRYQNATGTTKIDAAPYYFGTRYVDTTLTSPEQLHRIYENPPQTTEELLHALPPGSEPVAPLSVTVETARETTVQKRFGEMYARALLGTALSESTAAQAADGWGNDRRVVFGSGTARDYAWILRWDDPANATEFERGVETYLDARSELNATAKLTRVAPETTVLLVGSESFVGSVSATGTNGTATVRA